MRLLEALRKIEKEELVSFHMPGHKNHPMMSLQLERMIALDITEIPGADHLHDAHDCILETQNKIKHYYGAYQSRLIINGSTAGILSMIMGALKPGESVLLNRNAHKSIYNAVEMGRLKPFYFWPLYDSSGLVIQYDFHKFRQMIMDYKEIKAVVLTYPTYEGICYNIKEMIEYCHTKDILVLVDEAHGAHLKTFAELPISALDLGADIVVQSFHKTLPAMTQTACLHFGEQMNLRQDVIERVDYYLSALQTSSPSYPLMASIDAMLTIIDEKGLSLNTDLYDQINDFYQEIKALKTMHFKRYENQDFYKLILHITDEFYIPDVWDGHSIAKLLREKHHIQVEYDQPYVVLFMASMCNVKSDFERLKEALYLMDHWRIKIKKIEHHERLPFSSVFDQLESSFERVFLPEEAKLMAKIEVDLEEALGQISADYIIPYPPGIPICVPGERIDEKMILLHQILEKNIMGQRSKIKIIERSPEQQL